MCGGGVLMKAAFWYGTRDVRIKEIDEPSPGPGEVKIKVKWCGICGSDLHEYLNGPMSIPVENHPLTKKKAPVQLGHEFSGEITEVGRGASSFRPGDRVVCEATLSCMHCPACSRGDFTHCEKMGIYGISGYGGGFAEYTLAKKEFVHKIPDNLDFEKAALAEPVAVGFHSVTESGFVPGKNAVVLGGGPIALGVIESLKASGARKIIAVVRKSVRQSYAARSGADIVLDPDVCDAAAEIIRLTGGGADFCFETFGTAPGPEIGIKCLGSRGTLVIISLWNEDVPVDLMRVVQKEIRIVGSNLYTGDDFEAVLSLLSDGRIPAEGYITGRVPLDELVTKGFEELSGPDKKKHVKIIVTPDESLL